MRTSSPGVAAALALSLVASACGGGDSAEKKLFNQQKALCQGLVANHQTLAQGFAAMVATRPTIAIRGGPSRCKPDTPPGQGYAPLGSGDNCNYTTAGQSVCSTLIEWLAADGDLCNSNTGGCVYSCELRTMAADGPPDPNSGVSDAPLCGVKFVSGDPFI
jgi:hypothetical protein